MDHKNLDELVLRFFEILETEEESEGGHMFHPTTISSCRIFVTKELAELLPDMKDAAYRDQQLRQMREWVI